MNRRAMWRLYLMCATTGESPSKQLRITDDEWAAYQFDYAVIAFGRYVESKTADGKTTVAQLLALTEARSPRANPVTAPLLKRQPIKVKKMPWDE